MFEMFEVKKESQDVLENLLEYYLYDFNNYYDDDLNDKGRFEFIDVKPYINNENNKAYIIKVNNKYAGFILIKKTAELNSIEEFWIMPKYRKGMFAFKVLNSIFSQMNGKVEFLILNKNARWLKTVNYWIHKNYQVLKVQNVKKWDTEDFTKFTILV